jgi:ABC-2 type transport system permease protein
MVDPTSLFVQLKRALVIARKDIRIYYSKGPVVIIGLLLPVFLFLSFSIGRNLSLDSLMPGLMGMTVFFTAASMSPIITPFESQGRTLERLMVCPISFKTIVFGDILYCPLSSASLLE